MDFSRITKRHTCLGISLICLILVITGGFAAPARAAKAPEAAGKTAVAAQNAATQAETVDKKPAGASKDASALTIITQDDIRRSGASSIPEALRMAPGLEVARINANVWAISARGFNGQYANKLMVAVDGRSAYSSLYGGVFWDVQDMLLEDIERIEVTRGPDATEQGGGAVNGSINIITKHSSATQGGLSTLTAGTREREGAFRYGGRLGGATTYRMYVKDFRRSGGVDSEGENTPDSWQQLRAGFRLDHDSQASQFNIQGETYSGREGQTLRIASLEDASMTEQDDAGRVAGGNLNARWRYAFSKDSVLNSQLTFERSEMSTGLLKELRTILYLDIRHQFNLGPLSNLSWGFGYRRTTDDVTGSFAQSFDPQKRTDAQGHFYLLDDISLFKDYVRLSLGDRLEHNGYTGWEHQPSARVLFTPSPVGSLWGSVSKAVRTPARAQVDATQVQAVSVSPVANIPQVYTLQGSPEVISEEVTAYELGCRILPLPWFNLDIAAFYNDYDKLRSVSTGAAYTVNDPRPYRVFPSIEGNALSGTTKGYETTLNFHVRQWLRVDLMYTRTEVRLHKVDEGVLATQDTLPGASPHKQYAVKTSLDLGPKVDLDVLARHVDELPDLDVPAYTGLDARLGYRPLKGLEIALIGKNLLETRHAEFNPQDGELVPSEVARSVAGKVTWQF